MDHLHPGNCVEITFLAIRGAVRASSSDRELASAEGHGSRSGIRGKGYQSEVLGSDELSTLRLCTLAGTTCFGSVSTRYSLFRAFSAAFKRTDTSCFVSPAGTIEEPPPTAVELAEFTFEILPVRPSHRQSRSGDALGSTRKRHWVIGI